jgi:hypothetical protein
MFPAPPLPSLCRLIAESGARFIGNNDFACQIVSLIVYCSMDTETLKVLVPYFISILGAIVAIGITVYNNSKQERGKLMDDVEKVDMDFLADGVAGKQS